MQHDEGYTFSMPTPPYSGPLRPAHQPTRAQRWVAGFGLVLLLICFALPAHAQWKWRDAGGRLQISDLPPPHGTPEKDILQRPAGYKPPPIFIVPYGSKPDGAATAASAPSSAPSKAEIDRLARQREQEKRQEREAQEKQKQEDRRYAEQKRENCGRAKENLRMLQDGMRISRLNERGENVIIDDRQRAEEIQRSRAVMASECQ